MVLPRAAGDQAAAVARAPFSEVRVGDLLFFHDLLDPSVVDHRVGLYVGRGHIIHAPTVGKTGEVKTMDLSADRPWGDDVVAGRPSPPT